MFCTDRLMRMDRLGLVAKRGEMLEGEYRRSKESMGRVFNVVN